MSDPPVIEWTVAKRDRLAIAYQHAVEEDLPQIRFEGHVLVTGYAKYLLQYLNQRLPPTVPKSANSRR